MNQGLTKELIQSGVLPWHEGKTVQQFTDRWGDRPAYCVPLRNMSDKLGRLNAARYYRLGFRKVARSTDDRTAIFTVIPPGFITSDSLLIESHPERRPNTHALSVCGLANSFTFDWLLRQAVSANVTFNYLDPQPIPDLSPIMHFLAHVALRLLCNHEGYAPLWRDQLDRSWREPSSLFSWPVLATGPSRLEARAALDAIVAHHYGLTSDMFSYLLTSFDHSASPDNPGLCLAKFDEYAAIGAAAFTRKYDPYWDIPLVETLPQPVIELPGVEGEAEHFSLSAPPHAPRARRGRGRTRT